jgi:hypothetical protein
MADLKLHFFPGIDRKMELALAKKSFFFKIEKEKLFPSEQNKKTN